jgi:flavin reductase (DIM6/NTAB) family NADH-FMN oxidoreductase RutF
MNINPKELNENIFKLIGDDWMLITAGNRECANTMTASFGGFGILCFKNVAHIYVRPERHTYNFLENNDTFSLSFFNDNYKDKLKYCGKVSGKNEDKIKECGFDLKFTDDETPYFKQAHITIICKKMYAQDLDKNCFCDQEAYDKTYSSGGIHKMYIGEIREIIIN